MHRGIARLFKMRGWQGGLRGEQGADWDSKWRLSIDLCTKCNFIWGARGGAEFLPGGQLPPCPPLATPLLIQHTSSYLWDRKGQEVGVKSRNFFPLMGAILLLLLKISKRLLVTRQGWIFFSLPSKGAQFFPHSWWGGNFFLETSYPPGNLMVRP